MIFSSQQRLPLLYNFFVKKQNYFLQNSTILDIFVHFNQNIFQKLSNSCLNFKNLCRNIKKKIIKNSPFNRTI